MNEYPLDKNGKPMEFLAQINFDEIENVLEDYHETTTKNIQTELNFLDIVLTP